ncbi:MAG: pseudouridine synthase [Erysipelotrichaceae bacterium]|jgi:23S rRNA pseudouridine2605 synthase|nr:pseudouridine synthase [Bacillota bacterium]
MERLQKIIAQAGIASRRKAEELILEGKVKVDGEIITELGFKAKKNAVIEVNGKIIEKEDKVYFVLNKPKRYLSSVSDHRDRKTVVDLIDTDKRIFPVGRLDYDTTGLIILTNDGEFANEIIHPRYSIEKEYDVTIRGILRKDEIRQLEEGIYLDNKKTLPARVVIVNVDRKRKITDLQLTIREGRNHQVKKMMKYFGHRVTKLNRRRLGIVTLKGLQIGEYRRLKPFEIKQLKSLANENKLIK